MAATIKDIKTRKAMAASEGFALALTAAMTVGKQGSALPIYQPPFCR